jgi:hypothetical protein
MGLKKNQDGYLLPKGHELTRDRNYSEWATTVIEEDEEYKMKMEYWQLNDSHLAYHYSWDWMMPVLEKIEEVRCKFQIEKNKCKIWALAGFSSSTTIDATYEAVRAFLEWHNKTKKS